MKVISTLCLLLWLLTINTASAQSADGLQKSVLWRVSGNGLPSESFLFGTIHQICKDDLKLTDSLQAALGHCKVLVLEADISKVKPMKVMRMTRMKDTTLEQLISPEDYQLLKDFFRDSLGIPLNLMDKTKPLYLLAVVMSKSMDCSLRDATSFEEALIKASKQYDMKIEELEGIKKQMEIIDRIPLQSQARELTDALQDYRTQAAEMHKLYALYESQDVDGIALMAEQGMNDSFIYNDLLRDRNQDWIPLMEKMMKDNACFFGVGAGHLGGQDGLIRLLRQAGYKVEPIISTNAE